MTEKCLHAQKSHSDMDTSFQTVPCCCSLYILQGAPVGMFIPFCIAGQGYSVFEAGFWQLSLPFPPVSVWRECCDSEEHTLQSRTLAGGGAVLEGC